MSEPESEHKSEPKEVPTAQHGGEEQNHAAHVQSEPKPEQDPLEQLRVQNQRCESQLRRALADFDNLQKSQQREIDRRTNDVLDRCFLDFLQIYDDFVRARQSLSNTDNAAGLDSILKNMDEFLAKYHIVPIEALGELFDPNLHEAIAITHDDTLDDSAITKEIRKGYTSHNRIIRPSLVEISKR